MPRALYLTPRSCNWRPGENTRPPRRVFRRAALRSGTQLRHATLVDDPSIFTVQAFSLITWYMVTACRRIRAIMHLGFAVQPAYTLGIHRHEANSSFGPHIAKSRERAWKTLRVCDLFLSASMGRPSITSRIDSNIPSESSSSDANERLASAMNRIC